MGETPPFSKTKQRTLMFLSWMVTIIRREAVHPTEVAHRSAWRRSTAAFGNDLHQHVRSPAHTTVARRQSSCLPQSPTTTLRYRCSIAAGSNPLLLPASAPQWPYLDRHLRGRVRSSLLVALVHGGGSSGSSSRFPDKVNVSEEGTSTGKTGPVEPNEREGGCSGIAMDSLVERVVAALRHRCGVMGGDQVLVLVSGGSDSVALLLALHEASEAFQPRLRLETVHFNHALRGEESDADQDFVEGLAERLGVKLHIRRWKGVEQGGTGGDGPGVQERARKWRQSEARDILSGMVSTTVEAGAGGGVGDEGGGFIATGHHWDDDVETMLMKTLRGSHITNMQGMAWHSPPFVRPLLGVRKSDLMEFLQRRGQGWREDPSNRVPKYARNRVRLELVPLLQDLAGGAAALDTRLAEMSRQSLLAREMVEREALRWEKENLGGERLGQRVEEFPLKAFVRGGDERLYLSQPLPELVREELLHRFVTGNTGVDTPLPYAQLQLLMRQVDDGGRMWSLSLEGGFCLRRIGDFLRIEPDTGRRKNGSEQLGRRNFPGAFFPAATPWTLRVLPCEGVVGDSGDSGEGVDVGIWGMMLYNVPDRARLHVRRRKEGDRFRPVWRDRPMKLKDFLRGQGVPLHRRDQVALVCDEHDTVIAVYPNYPAFEFGKDKTEIKPVRVTIAGTPLFCPRPGSCSDRARRTRGCGGGLVESDWNPTL